MSTKKISIPKLPRLEPKAYANSMRKAMGDAKTIQIAEDLAKRLTALDGALLTSSEVFSSIQFWKSVAGYIRHSTKDAGLLTR